MRIAILGFGTMGQMITNAILKNSGSNINIVIGNRTAIKMNDLNMPNKHVEIAPDFVSAITNAEIIFLCVKPLACLTVLASIKDKMLPSAHLVSIASDVSICNLSSMFSGKISRIIPTLVTKINLGITLLAKNKNVTQKDDKLLHSLFGDSVKFKLIPENEFNIVSSITSCGPGLIATLLNEFISSICRSNSFDRETIHQLVLETVIATCELSKTQDISFPEILEQVATKGGITECGSKILKNRLPELFDLMNSSIAERHYIRSQEIDNLPWRENSSLKLNVIGN